MKIRHVIGKRPNVPENWIICNAPRPICGTKTWVGPFITGRLYAGIAPNDEQHDWMIMHNTSQDAVQVIYHTEDEIVQVALAYFARRYPNQVVEIDPDKERGFLKIRGLDLLNEGE